MDYFKITKDTIRLFLSYLLIFSVGNPHDDIGIVLAHHNSKIIIIKSIDE